MISEKMRKRLDENIYMGMVEEIPLWDFDEEKNKDKKDIEKKSNKDKDDKK